MALIAGRKLRAGGVSVSFVFSRDVVGGEVTCEEVFADYDDIGTDVLVVAIGHAAHDQEDILGNDEDIREHDDFVHSWCINS